MTGLFALIKNYILLEYRSWTQGLGLIILVWIIAYLLFRLNPELPLGQINLVYWLFILLVAVNAAMRQEAYYSPEERLNLYTMADPGTVITARIIFNALYLWIISILFYLFIIVYFSPSVTFNWAQLGLLSVGAVSISSCLSMVTAMGVQGGGQNTLVSILGFPLLIPVILLLNNVNQTLIMTGEAPFSKYILILGISAMGLALSLVLFPFVWKQ